MKFRSIHRPEVPSIQLAPMIDVVFLLLIFFLVTWSYARFDTELDISVPKADESKDPKRRIGELMINVRADGTVIVNAAPMDDEELLAALGAVAELRPDQSIILRGDENAAYKHIARVLNICHKVKIYNVAFAAAKPQALTSP